MDPITLTAIIVMGIICLFQYGRRVSIQSDYDTIVSELETVLTEIERSKKGSGIRHLTLRNKLVKTFFGEFVKLYLQQKLSGRIEVLKQKSEPSKGLNSSVFLVSENDVVKCSNDEKPPMVETKDGKKYIVKHVNPVP